LLYRAGGKVMAVRYSVQGDTFVPEKPRVWTASLGAATGFDLAPEGKRLVIVTPAETAQTPQRDHHVVFLFNFFDELRRRVPFEPGSNR
jgi:hypothetical protein